MKAFITQYAEVDADGREWIVNVLPDQKIRQNATLKIGITTEIEKAVTGILWGKTGEFT